MGDAVISAYDVDNGALMKPPFQLGHGRVIAFRFMYMIYVYDLSIYMC